MISGKSDSSLQNGQFIENIGHTVDLSKTSINKYNFSIDKSSTYYITKKIYGNKEDYMDFDLQSNAFYDFRFGYLTEILGKSLFTISFDQIYYLMNSKIPLDQLNIKLFIERKEQNGEVISGDLGKLNLNFKDQYELLILEENDNLYKFES